MEPSTGNGKEGVDPYQKVVLGFGTLAIINSIVVMSLICIQLPYIMPSWDTVNEPKPRPIACVSGETFLSNENLWSKFLTKNEDGKEKLCAYDSDQMSQLLEQTMQRKEPSPELSGPQAFNITDFHFSSVSAHKRLLPPGDFFNLTEPRFGEKPVVVKFQLKEDSYNHARGVEVNEFGMTMPGDGVYFLYSSIHFRPIVAYPCKMFKYQTWSHYMEKVSADGSESTLLRTFFTCCDSCTRAEETSYTNGVFDLKKGDVIRVKVSGEGIVYFRGESSFAGVVDLPSASVTSQS